MLRRVKSWSASKSNSTQSTKDGGSKSWRTKSWTPSRSRSAVYEEDATKAEIGAQAGARAKLWRASTACEEDMAGVETGAQVGAQTGARAKYWRSKSWRASTACEENMVGAEVGAQAAARTGTRTKYWRSKSWRASTVCEENVMAGAEVGPQAGVRSGARAKSWRSKSWRASMPDPSSCEEDVGDIPLVGHSNIHCVHMCDQRNMKKRAVFREWMQIARMTIRDSEYMFSRKGTFYTFSLQIKSCLEGASGQNLLYGIKFGSHNSSVYGCFPEKSKSL